MFGRKKVQSSSPPSSPPSPPPPPSAGGDRGDPRADPGHQAVLRHLDEREKEEPLARAQVAGGILFDLFVRLLASDKGVRIEDLIAALASIGGHLCLAAAMDQLGRQGLSPKAAGMMVVADREDNLYYFGDAPNRLLIESETSLLGLALGAAQAHGAPVSLEMVHEAVKRTAASVGSADFGKAQVPETHQPSMSPFDWVRHGRLKLIEALDVYEVPLEMRPAAVGFALQRAISEGGQVLEPLVSARIAIDCAIPMAKVDPARFA
jgi:hypothetical protein